MTKFFSQKLKKTWTIDIETNRCNQKWISWINPLVKHFYFIFFVGVLSEVPTIGYRWPFCQFCVFYKNVFLCRKSSSNKRFAYFQFSQLIFLSLLPFFVKYFTNIRSNEFAICTKIFTKHHQQQQHKQQLYLFIVKYEFQYSSNRSRGKTTF